MRPQQVEDFSRCMAISVMIMLVALFCGGLFLRPTHHNFPHPHATTYHNNVESLQITEQSGIEVTKEELRVVNERNLDAWDLNHGLGDCCFRAADGGIYNKVTEEKDWHRTLHDKNPYW